MRICINHVEHVKINGNFIKTEEENRDGREREREFVLIRKFY